MAGFSFDVNDELNNIRKRPGTGASKPAEGKPPATAPAEPDEWPDAPKAEAQAPLPQPAPREVPAPEPQGFGVDQSHQESNTGAASSVRRKVDLVNWKGFKTLDGVFEFVGGARPVVLQVPVARSQVSGLPEPLILALQDQLKQQHAGKSVKFPWGSFVIDSRNRVFTTKLSLFRYLLFDGFRDSDDIQLQYAKQWLLSYHPAAFDTNFNTEILKQSSDELDIYALLIVATGTEDVLKPEVVAESEFLANDQLDLMNSNMTRLMDMVNNQSTALETLSERNDTLQTVMLLDRMGLLRGGLPKDPGEFVRVLEQNRGAVETMSATVTDHIKAEKERIRVLEREARMRSVYTHRR